MRIVGDLGDEGDVLARRQARDQIVELEDEADVLAPVLGQQPLAGADEIVVAEPCLAAGRRVQAAEDVEQCRLAAARRAEQDDELALTDIEVHGSQRDDVDFPNSVDLRQATRHEHRARFPGGTLRRRLRPRADYGTGKLPPRPIRRRMSNDQPPPMGHHYPGRNGGAFEAIPAQTL